MNCGTRTTLTKQALKIYELLGFKELTEIQRNALKPLLTSELDVLLIAPTGSGKTEAALIPLLVRIITNQQGRGIKILYITPLRALNRDILERVNKIAAKVDLSVDVWHGDTPHGRRRRICEHPPDILITTPESFQYLLINKKIVEHFKTLYAIVIDEAQELIESERGAELVCALERLDYRLRRHIRRVALSATTGSEDTIAHYIFSGRSHIIVRSYLQKQYDVRVISYDISHSVAKPAEFLLAIPIIISVLREALKKHRQVLLFVNTRITAEALAYHLSKALQSNAMQGINIAVHHASLSRIVREEVERSLRERILNLVIATSSLEMGIDIGSIDIVLHLHSPRQAKRLAQRIGRAGHRWNAVSKGIIITPPLVTEVFETLTLARRTVERDYEPLVTRVASLDVLAHQIVGIAVEYNKVSIDTLLNILRRAPPFSNLSMYELEEVIEFLHSLNLIKRYNEYVEATLRGKLYYLTTTPIVESKHYVAKSIIDGRTLGVLDEEFVATCNEGDILVLGGSVWKLLSLDLDREEVILEPVVNPSEIKIPHWVGENIPVDWRVARETCSLIRRFCSFNDEENSVEILKRYFADDRLVDYILKIRKEICKVYPRDNELVIEVTKSNTNALVAFYHCQGSKVSEVLSLLLTRLFRKSGERVYGYKSHQLASVLLLGQTLSVNTIKRVILDLIRLNKDEISRILVEELKETPLFKWRLLAVAKKLGIVSKDASLRELRKHIEALRNVGIVVKEALRELMSERLDIDTTISLLNRIRSQRTRIRIYVTSRPSRYLTEILSLTPFTEFRTATSIIDSIIYETVKRRLLERNITLFCLSCLKSWSTKLSSLLQNTIDSTNTIYSKHKICCPRCGSQTLTLISNENEIPLLKSALHKLRKGLYDPAQYTDNERRVLKRAQIIANLIMDYGVFALIALQGRGVGPETAKRILSRATTLDDLIKLVYESEKEFLRTHHYWHHTSK